MEIDNQQTILNFLPGPVQVRKEIAEIFLEEPLSHRSNAFSKLLTQTKEKLKFLVNAENVEIMCGSGTLANDIVAHQLGCLPGNGIIFSSGEFGKRLSDHARRIGLNFDEYSSDNGQIVDLDSIQPQSNIKWLWTVHCETSTGSLYDLRALKRFARKYNLCLAVDCISSIGLTNIDLDGIHFATATSGKGIGSFAGLAIVFYKEIISTTTHSIPRYLDLGYYAHSNGVPFTLQWNQIKALFKATSHVIETNKPALTAALDTSLRKTLRKGGIQILPSNYTAPGIITITMENAYSSRELGEALEDMGIMLHYSNRYLLEKNWVQICLMTEHTEESIKILVTAMKNILNRMIEI